MFTRRFASHGIGSSYQHRGGACIPAVLGSLIVGLFATESHGQYIFYASQSRVVTASSLDGPTVTISAPNYFPFSYTALSRNPFDACWASASQASTLEDARITMVGATRGFRSSTFIPYPSASTSLDATFHIYGTCFFRLSSTWTLAQWSLTGPGVNVVSFGSVGQTTRGGTLVAGEYALHLVTSLDHGGGTIFPTDVSVDFQVTRCIADLDDGSGSGTPDGGIGIEDLLYYLLQYDQGSLRADVDDGTGSGTPDGGVGIEDLLYYLARYDGGC